MPFAASIVLWTTAEKEGLEMSAQMSQTKTQDSKYSTAGRCENTNLVPCPHPIRKVSLNHVSVKRPTFNCLPVAVFAEQCEDFASQAGLPRLDKALHVDQEAALLPVHVSRHQVLNS